MDETDRLALIRDSFDRQAERFDAYAATADAARDRYARALGRAAAGRILDVACGTGVVTAAVARTAAHVTGLDATEAMLARARARCEGLTNVAFTTGDAEALPFPDAAFDGVVTRLALHHFAHPARALGEIARVLRPGGRAVVADVTASEDRDRAGLQNAIETLRDPSHARMMPAAEIDGLVAASGLRIVATEDWEKPREAGEWIGISAAPVTAGPLATVLRALAGAGLDAGIELALRGDQVTFVHAWHLAIAEKPRPGPCP